MVSIYNLSPDHCKQSLVLNLSLNILAQIWLMGKKLYTSQDLKLDCIKISIKSEKKKCLDRGIAIGYTTINNTSRMSR